MEILENSITMCKPADMHNHFRHDWRLPIVAPLVAQRFQMAVAMPNLDPPVTTLKQMDEHWIQVRKATAKTDANFRPLMTLYLTDTLDPHEVEKVQLPSNMLLETKRHSNGYKEIQPNSKIN
jgi:dihydroorotase